MLDSYLYHVSFFGAQMTITSPARTTMSAELYPTAPVSESPSILRVLVVDDNDDAAEALAVYLEMTGHEVRTARDGPAALAAAREFRPAAVVLDVSMPGIDGCEVA